MIEQRRALIDALAYEGIVTGDIDGLGTISLIEGTPVSVRDSDSAPGSLARLPNGTDTDNAAADWTFSATPTPGAPNAP